MFVQQTQKINIIQPIYIIQYYIIISSQKRISTNPSSIDPMLSNNSTVSVSSPPKKFHLKAIENRSVVDISLDHAIKKSNVKGFLNRGLMQLTENGNQAENGTGGTGRGGLEQHLLQLKKSVSQISKEMKDKERDSLKFRDEANFTLQKVKKLREERQRLQDKINQLQKNVQKVNTKRQAASHSSKTYEHILERMKKDSILKLFCKNELQRQLKCLQKTQTMTKAKHYSVSQLQKLSILGLKDAHQQHQKQQTFRKNNLNHVNKESLQKIRKQNKLRESQTQSDQIHQMGACDIQDADLMRLKKFLTVQVFLRGLLKSKLSKLKKFYQPYQHAFFKIKSKTSVRDASSLKHEFFNFETTFNEKTLWIKDLQYQINQAEQQNKQLKNKLNQERLMEMEIIENLEIEKDKGNASGSGHDGGEGKGRQLSQKSLFCELLWERIRAWCEIQGKKMGIINENKNGDEKLEEVIGVIISKLKLSLQQKEKQKQADIQLGQKDQSAQKDQEPKKEEQNKES